MSCSRCVCILWCVFASVEKKKKPKAMEATTKQEGKRVGGWERERDKRSKPRELAAVKDHTRNQAIELVRFHCHACDHDMGSKGKGFRVTERERGGGGGGKG